MVALISLGEPINTTLPYQKGILSKYSKYSNQIPALEVNN